MGDPKKARAKFNPPRNPWRSDQLSQELYLLGTYGLRNKRELWRAQTQLSNIRKQARQLLAAPSEIRGREEPKLLAHLATLGLIQSEQRSLDDILSLTIENLLERRLQTLVWKRGLAHTPYQARQYVVHGHITLRDRRVDVPSYLVLAKEEGTLRYSDGSKLGKVPAPAEVTAPDSAPQEVASEPAPPEQTGAS